jgi:hypothetical protein
MITVEYHGDDVVITLMDSNGNCDDLEVSFTNGGESMVFRQFDEDGYRHDVIIIGPSQASGLLRTLLAIAKSQDAPHES